jgi:hypothetical protein
MDHKSLEKNGYAIFDFPNPGRLDQLHVILSELIQQKQNAAADDQGFYFASFDSDSAFRKKVHDLIAAEMEPVIQQYFPEYKAVVANIILKEPGDREVPLHQDWSFVDETHHLSYAIWVPLCETTRENGGLFVLDGSHQWFSNYRSTKVNTKCIDLYPHLKQHLKFMEIKKGQGVIFNHRLMHYTPPNITNTNRIVAQTAIIPKTVQPFFPYRESDDQDITIYQVNDAFFINENIWAKPVQYPVFKVVANKDNDTIDLRVIRKNLRKKNPIRYHLNEWKK